MQTRRALELTVGLGLLLGPLAYALTLDDAAELECPAAAPVAAEPVAAEPAVVVGDADRCEPSERGPAAEPTPELTPVAEPSFAGERAEFLFVTDAGIVLSTAAERGWTTGRLFEPPGTVSYRAAKRADPAALPSELWGQAGRRYDLYGRDGKLCTARLGEPRVVAQYDGWGLGGVLGDEWYDKYGEELEAAKPAEIRKALWQRDDLWLVAPIATDGPCEGALWARDAELPAPAILRQSAVPNPSTKARRAEFRRSEELASTKEFYEKAHAELLADDPDNAADYPSWAEMVRANGLETWSWVDAHGQPRLVGLEFGQTGDGCGDPLDSWMSSLDLVRADSFEPVYGGHRPAAVFDLDHDGQLELLYRGEDGSYLASATVADDAPVEYDAYCPC